VANWRFHQLSLSSVWTHAMSTVTKLAELYNHTSLARALQHVLVFQHAPVAVGPRRDGARPY
jgi:hypothetical protein